jgi:antibiotic biosynthesis monooxygenase (ABM) superfamily enzyme
MYMSGTLVGVANAALFHPVDSIRIRYFFLPRSKKTVHMDDIRGVSFWKGLGTNMTPPPLWELVVCCKMNQSRLNAGFNIFATALKQMAFYPTQELLKHVCIAKGGMGRNFYFIIPKLHDIIILFN